MYLNVFVFVFQNNNNIQLYYQQLPATYVRVVPAVRSKFMRRKKATLSNFFGVRVHHNTHARSRTAFCSREGNKFKNTLLYIYV